MSSFSITLAKDDNGSLLVTVPALPEVTTFGDTVEEAQENAEAAIEEALAARMAHGQDVPFPMDGRVAGLPCARVSALTTTKVSLYRMLRDSGLSRAQLARKLGWHREQLDRLFRLDHASRLDQLEKAFQALGFEINLTIALA